MADAADDEAEQVPHYMLPNFASILPSYGNVDSDRIRDAFRPANFVTLRDVKETGERRPEERGTVMRTSGASKSGLFQEFEYVPSAYDLAGEIATRERLADEAKRLDMAGGRAFVCAGSSRKLKHESMYETGEAYPYLSDPFEAAHDQMVRMRWIEDSKILHGAWVPSGKQQTVGEVSRAMLPEIISELHALVAADWGEEYRFSVLATEDDYLAVRFDEASIEGEGRGLAAYMGTLAASNEVIESYKLIKCAEDWNSRPGDGFVYYLFRPPWVRVRHVDTYFTLHPEERRAGAGTGAPTS